MSDATNTTTGGWSDWTNVWVDAQQRYMDAWSQLVRPPAGDDPTSPAAANPLAQGLELWTKMAQGALPEQSRDLGEHLGDLSRSYLQMAEGMWRLAEGTQQAANAGADWQKAWQEKLCELQTSLGTLGGKAVPAAGLATFWGLPLQHFRQLASSLCSLPGDVEKTLQEGGPLSPETLRRAMGSMLSAPTLGYTREWQQDAQQWLELWLDHLQALRAYEGVFTKVGRRAMELLGAKLTAMAQDGKSLGGLRDSYNLWVDCGEEAYGEIAQTEEFARIQAHLTNTLMAVKRHEQHVVTEIQGSLNMPTRKELDTTHRRVHQLRREIRVAGHRIETLEEALEELQALKQAIRELQQGIAPPQPTESAPSEALPETETTGGATQGD